MKLPISACIIGLNEEDKIEDCLKSVYDLADEIVYVDSYSTDKTVAIAEKYTDKIVKQKFLGHIEQKNLAVKLAKNDWILSLDCDERLTEEASAAIRKEWEDKTYDRLYSAYSFKRLTFYIYRFIRHSGWYPDRKIRLFNRNFAKWSGENPHDKVECQNSNVKSLAVDILHYSFDSISDHLKTIDSFSTIGAREAFKKGKKSGFFILMARTFWAGFRKFFLEFSFLDGMAGIILTGLSMAATWSKYSRLYLMNREKKEKNRLK